MKTTLTKDYCKLIALVILAASLASLLASCDTDETQTTWSEAHAIRTFDSGE